MDRLQQTGGHFDRIRPNRLTDALRTSVWLFLLSCFTGDPWVTSSACHRPPNWQWLIITLMLLSCNTDVAYIFTNSMSIKKKGLNRVVMDFFFSNLHLRIHICCSYMKCVIVKSVKKWFLYHNTNCSLDVNNVLCASDLTVWLDV